MWLDKIYQQTGNKDRYNVDFWDDSKLVDMVNVWVSLTNPIEGSPLAMMDYNTVNYQTECIQYIATRRPVASAKRNIDFIAMVTKMITFIIMVLIILQ
jgi:hypothetical protein